MWRSTSIWRFSQVILICLFHLILRKLFVLIFFSLLCSNQWLKLSTLVLPLEDENFYLCVNMGFRKHGSLGFKESFFLNNICDCGFFLIWLLKSFTWPLLKTVCKQFLKSSCDYCQIAFWKWCCVLFENLFENFVDCYLENNFVNDFEFYEKKDLDNLLSIVFENLLKLVSEYDFKNYVEICFENSIVNVYVF